MIYFYFNFGRGSRPHRYGSRIGCRTPNTYGMHQKTVLLDNTVYFFDQLMKDVLCSSRQDFNTE